MSTNRTASAPLTVLLGCAPADLPAVRALAQRLRADGLSPALVADLFGNSGASPHALREALHGAGAVLVCLSRRAWTGKQLVTPLANLLDLLALQPDPQRLVVALKLTSGETPTALREALSLDLFSASGYQLLLATLAEHALAIAPPPPVPVEEPLPPAQPVPALSLQGGFGLPTLDRQGLQRRLGRGVARAVFMVGPQAALVVSGGGPALIDLAGGAPRWAIDCPTRCAALSPSGQLLALATAATIYLWDLQTGALRGVCSGHSETVSALNFAPDERTLASASLDRTVRLWRTGDDTGRPPALLVTLPNQGDQLTSVAFSPDGALLAAGGADRTVRIWRTLDRAMVQSLGGHGGAVEALAFSPDGGTLAAGSRGRTVRLWRVQGWQMLQALEGHAGAIAALAFDPDGGTLASGSEDGTVRFWRLSDGTLERVLEGHNGPVAGLAFSPDGATFVSVGENDQLLGWRTSDGAQLAALRSLSNRVTALALSDDGTLLGVGANDGTVTLQRIEGEPMPRTRQPAQHGAITSLAFAPNERLLVAASDRTVHSYRLDGSDALVLLRPPRALYTTSLAPGGRLLASSDGETTVQLWQLAGARAAADSIFWRVLRGLRSRARLLVFAPGAGALAVGCDDEQVRLWRIAELESDRPEPALSLKFGGRVRCLAFSADERLLAAGGDGGAAQIWRTSDGGEVAAVPKQGRELASLAFAPDGRSLASGDSGGQLRIWRLPSGNTGRPPSATTTILGHSGAVEQLLFSANGSYLISGSADGTVRIWRV